MRLRYPNVLRSRRDGWKMPEQLYQRAASQAAEKCLMNRQRGRLRSLRKNGGTTVPEGGFSRPTDAIIFWASAPVCLFVSSKRFKDHTLLQIHQIPVRHKLPTILSGQPLLKPNGSSVSTVG